MNKERIKLDLTSKEWIRCESKSRPGRYYMFNKATGETKWCSTDSEPPSEAGGEGGGVKKEVKDSPPKYSGKSIKTPAQDRLKRLQSNLKKDTNTSKALNSKREYNKNNRNKSNNANTENQVTSLKEVAAVATKDLDRESNTEEESLKRRLKRRRNGVATPTEQSSNVTNSKKHSPSKSSNKSSPAKSSTDKSSTNKRSTPESSPAKRSFTKTSSPKRKFPKRSIGKRSKPKTSPKKSPINSPEKLKETPQPLMCSPLIVPKIEPVSSDEPTNELVNTKTEPVLCPSYSLGIIDKIKSICKNTFKLNTKPSEIATSPFKVPKALSNHGLTNDAATQKNSFNAIEECNQKELLEGGTSSISLAQNDTVLLNKSPKLNINSTPQQQDIPAYPRGSANSRLERLRQSLFMQPSTSANSCINVTPSSSVTCCKSTNEVNKRLSIDAEPMDWQSTEESANTESIDITSSDTSVESNVSCSQLPTTTKTAFNADSTVGDYYDTVNENLLRFAAEKQTVTRQRSQKWLKDHYYFVIDTNVLLNNLTFIDDLTQMKLCGTNGTILYIPYSVLQELDKLKLRSHSEGAKTLTVRAIKYLNTKFEERNKFIHAQSALDERQHLIDITSPDDSILNCCLQVKQQVENVVLLTEDVNLRNKAICNNLLVSTKSDLVSKYASTSTTSLTTTWQRDNSK